MLDFKAIWLNTIPRNVRLSPISFYVFNISQVRKKVEFSLLELYIPVNFKYIWNLGGLGFLINILMENLF